METANRPTPTDLAAQFERTPFAFDFFRAVRLLECAHPGAARIGTSYHPEEDPIRFGQNPSLAFAPSTIVAFVPGEEGAPGKMIVRFFGLFGPNGPLPIHLTEYAHDLKLQAKDEAMIKFCDIFHHRLLSLFYRAWAVNQKAVDFDRAEFAEAEGTATAERWTGPRFAMYIASFFGLGMEALRRRDEIPDWAKLYYSGRLACQTHNAEGLGAIVQEFFGTPAEVQTFSGHWLTLPPESVCELGDSPATGSLGETTIVGSRFWDCQLKFRLRLGAMSLAVFQRLLPIGKSFRQLNDWVRLYAGDEFFWDIQLVLQAAEVPKTTLGKAGMLGWTTWLRDDAPFTCDADDLILDPTTR